MKTILFLALVLAFAFVSCSKLDFCIAFLKSYISSFKQMRESRYSRISKIFKTWNVPISSLIFFGQPKFLHIRILHVININLAIFYGYSKCMRQELTEYRKS